MSAVEFLILLEREFFYHLKNKEQLSRTDIYIIIVSKFFDNMTAYSISRKTGIDRPLITRRLKVLEEKGVITLTQKGRGRIISVNPKSQIVIDMLKKMIAGGYDEA